ncbi:hypothetical protein RFI_06338 [Reticulomyxa filosa]|uniref:Choline transporter-like protein n=1 Tax=Reticulomyxa filosa TaxID=46433 RepID=X6NY25_RETFI|nr:hypothetical protein RFI_06338 [Reticulomyxa filosa]|eukprot:ETO30783.1 hypothetical protein RFI_06338 [Reticulomyxa filosa]
MLNEASRAVRDVPTTVIFPVMYSFVGIAYFAFWLAVALYVFSCKEKATKNTPENLIEYFGFTYIDVTFNKDLQNALIYHLLCLVYLAQVISYFGFMVLAGVFADWYFSIWNSSQSRKIRGYGTGELSGSPVCESLFRVLRFHLGSLALGALVVTPVRLIRWILMSIKRSTQNAQNGATRCIFGCTNCCLQCLECLLDKINQEGFILTSIYGTNFCQSSFVAVKLIYTNVLRTALLEGISHYIEFFGRITIAAVTTGICLTVFSLDNYFRDNLSSVLSPGIAVFVIAYIIGSLFMLVYEVAVDTIFLCYLIDEQTHPNGPKFAHEDLAKMANKHKNSLTRKKVTLANYNRENKTLSSFLQASCTLVFLLLSTIFSLLLKSKRNKKYNHQQKKGIDIFFLNYLFCMRCLHQAFHFKAQILKQNLHYVCLLQQSFRSNESIIFAVFLCSSLECYVEEIYTKFHNYSNNTHYCYE